MACATFCVWEAILTACALTFMLKISDVQIQTVAPLIQVSKHRDRSDILLVTRNLPCWLVEENKQEQQEDDGDGDRTRFASII